MISETSIPIVITSMMMIVIIMSIMVVLKITVLIMCLIAVIVITIVIIGLGVMVTTIIIHIIITITTMIIIISIAIIILSWWRHHDHHHPHGHNISLLSFFIVIIVVGTIMVRVFAIIFTIIWIIVIVVIILVSVIFAGVIALNIWLLPLARIRKDYHTWIRNPHCPPRNLLPTRIEPTRLQMTTLSRDGVACSEAILSSNNQSPDARGHGCPHTVTNKRALQLNFSGRKCEVRAAGENAEQRSGFKIVIQTRDLSDKRCNTPCFWHSVDPRLGPTSFHTLTTLALWAQALGCPQRRVAPTFGALSLLHDDD